MLEWRGDTLSFREFSCLISSQVFDGLGVRVIMLMIL